MDYNLNFVTIEFSEDQECFHYAYLGDEVNTNGYQVIAENVEREIADDFTNFVYELIEHPTFKEIKVIFDVWFKHKKNEQN